MRIGTAGWSIPVAEASGFPAEGTSLERYASRFAAAEINSSFHRSHRAATWTRWAASVGQDFRFSAKLSKEITHRRKLVNAAEPIEAAVAEMMALGPKLGLVLVQLPPSLAFDLGLAEDFFRLLRQSWPGRIACEPRHPSWFEDAADAILARLEVARVAADPAGVEAAAVPGGWRGFTYYRLHGSPVPYRSSYEPERLNAYAAAIRRDLAAGRDVWCIFDNTASSAAAGNALALQELVRSMS